MKSKIVKKYIKSLLCHLLYYNRLAPFPVYDTDYVKDVENKLKNIMEDKKIDYDLEPVVACKYCKNLHIISDDFNNDICMRCGSTNELKEFKNIYEYKDFLNK